MITDTHDDRAQFDHGEEHGLFRQIDGALCDFDPGTAMMIVQAITKAWTSRAASMSPETNRAAYDRAQVLAKAWRYWLLAQRLSVLIEANYHNEDLPRDTTNLVHRDRNDFERNASRALIGLGLTCIQDILPPFSDPLTNAWMMIFDKEAIARREHERAVLRHLEANRSPQGRTPHPTRTRTRTRTPQPVNGKHGQSIRPRPGANDPNDPSIDTRREP
jgi:hypothetical protein